MKVTWYYKEVKMSQPNGALSFHPRDQSNIRRRIISSKDSTQSNINSKEENNKSLLKVIIHGKETYVDISGIRTVRQLLETAMQKWEITETTSKTAWNLYPMNISYLFTIGRTTYMLIFLKQIYFQLLHCTAVI